MRIPNYIERATRVEFSTVCHYMYVTVNFHGDHLLKFLVLRHTKQYSYKKLIENALRTNQFPTQHYPKTI